MSLKVTVREDGEGMWTVYAVGSLDRTTYPILRNTLEALGGEGARVIRRICRTSAPRASR